MSKDVDRKQVLQNIKVRNPFKNDGCWIRRSKDDKVISEAKQKPAIPEKSSFVLSAAKRFETSTNQTNNVSDPVKKDAVPEETRENTTRNTRSKIPSGQEINKTKTQEQQPVINTNSENKEVEAPAAKPNVEQNIVTASADANNEEEIQPASSTNNKADTAGLPPANKTAGVKEMNSDTQLPSVDCQASSDLQVKTSVTNTAEVLTTPQEEALIRAEPANTSSLEDTGEKVSAQTTIESPEKCLLQETKEEIVPAASELMVQVLPENTAAPDEEIFLQASVESDKQFESVSKSPAQPDNETPDEGSCEKQPPEQDNNETVQAEVESEVETPDGDNATPSEEVPPLNSVSPVTNTLPESRAAEEVIIAVKYEVDPEAAEEPVLTNRTEEVGDAKIESIDSTDFEQNVEPSLEGVIDTMELNIEDALRPIPDADAEGVDDSSDYRPTDLRNAQDVKVSQKEPVPKSEEPEHPHQEEPNPHPDDTKASEGIKKPAEELNSTEVLNLSRDGKPICSYCNKTVDGSVKITLNEPLVVCHPECLKCGVCAKALGDLLTRIFLHDNVIHCGGCFERALNI